MRKIVLTHRMRKALGGGGILPVGFFFLSRVIKSNHGCSVGQFI